MFTVRQVTSKLDELGKFFMRDVLKEEEAALQDEKQELAATMSFKEKALAAVAVVGAITGITLQPTREELVAVTATTDTFYGKMLIYSQLLHALYDALAATTNELVEQLAWIKFFTQAKEMGGVFKDIGAGLEHLVEEAKYVTQEKDQILLALKLRADGFGAWVACRTEIGKMMNPA